MNYELQCCAGKVIAHVCDDPPSITAADPADPDNFAAWNRDGIPALVGATQGDAQVELATTVPDTDPTWGLALLEAVEMRDWKLITQPGVVMAGEFKEDLHPRNSKGTEHGGQFTKKDEEERVKIPKLDLDVADMTQIGGSLGGSTPGAQYKDKDGTAWYVKTVQSKAHAMNEALAARLYNLAGVDCVEVHTINLGDTGTGVASKIIQLTGSASYNTPGATEGFAVDAWLGNWDVCGASFDNLQIDANGNAVRIDVGGSMVFRAKGGDKAAYFTGDSVGEINSLRDPNGKNPTTPKVFGPMSPDEVKASIMNTVGKVTDEQIQKTVDGLALQHKPATGIGGVSWADMRQRLRERRDHLVKLAQGIKVEKASKPKNIAPDIKGKVFDINSPVFGSTKGSTSLAPVEPAPKPKLSTGSQIHCMQDASNAAGMKFTADNWDHPAHPRPDKFGVPTNMNSMEFKRLLTVGQAMCSNWKGSAQSTGASQLKRAAQRAFQAQGIVYNNSDVDSKEQQWDNDRVARMIYDDTQTRLAAVGVTDDDRVKLYRGLSAQVITPGVLEGYSYDKTVAKKFNGHDVVVRHVAPSEIMLDNKSHFLNGGGFGGEMEWFVFAGGFGTVESHVASAKHEVSQPQQSQSGIASYSVVKPPGTKKLSSAKAVHPIVAEVKHAKEAGKWAKVNPDLILKVKASYAAGHKGSVISKAYNIAPSTIHGIIHGTTESYTKVGPRSKNMKKLLNVTEAQWKTVKENVAAHLKQKGTADFKAIGEAVGMTEWKARAVWFNKKKDE